MISSTFLLHSYQSVVCTIIGHGSPPPLPLNLDSHTPPNHSDDCGSKTAEHLIWAGVEEACNKGTGRGMG